MELCKSVFGVSGVPSDFGVERGRGVRSAGVAGEAHDVKNLLVCGLEDTPLWRFAKWAGSHV